MAVCRSNDGRRGTAAFGVSPRMQFRCAVSHQPTVSRLGRMAGALRAFTGFETNFNHGLWPSCWDASTSRRLFQATQVVAPTSFWFRQARCDSSWANSSFTVAHSTSRAQAAFLVSMLRLEASDLGIQIGGSKPRKS
ncbi:hypothetical protein PsYK624_055270 [Phanerochaete sordida]|uniref:Uncharacterized protein n=1 Tax=Phanerochaete sordida TaxID=48140 RepID=A0A9P3LBF3_9APHY|nr:hypothetical protein PsYK624_055270 [Phanerochaete sordida]